MLDRNALIAEAQVIYEGCAGDMAEFELEDAADFVSGRLYDEFGSIEGGYYNICLEALKGYF